MSNAYRRFGITGGALGNLDALDGSTLYNGDFATVHTSGNEVYFYKLNSASGVDESYPTVIAPDQNAGSKRWELCDAISADSLAHIADISGGVHGATPNSSPNMIVRRDANRDVAARTFIGALNGNADTATNAGHATNADSATNATYAASANTANYATSAGSTPIATNANNAYACSGNAATASFAANAGLGASQGLAYVSRAPSPSYYINYTGRPRAVFMIIQFNDSVGGCALYVNDIEVAAVGPMAPGYFLAMMAIVPTGGYWYYAWTVTLNNSIYLMAELG
jgi:hypothetical protein